MTIQCISTNFYIYLSITKNIYLNINLSLSTFYRNFIIILTKWSKITVIILGKNKLKATFVGFMVVFKCGCLIGWLRLQVHRLTTCKAFACECEGMDGMSYLKKYVQ